MPHMQLQSWVWSILSRLSLEKLQNLSFRFEWVCFDLFYISYTVSVGFCLFFFPYGLDSETKTSTAMTVHFHFAPLQSTLLTCLTTALITPHPDDLDSGGMIIFVQFYIKILSRVIQLLLKIVHLIERCEGQLLRFADVIRTRWLVLTLSEVSPH